MSEDREIKKWARILIALNWLRLGFHYLGVVIRILVGFLFVMGFILFISNLLAFPEAIEEYCNRVDCWDTYPMDEVIDEMFRDADMMWAVLIPILVWFYFSVPLILYLFVVWVFSQLLPLSDDEKKEFRDLYNEAIDEYKEIKIKEKESKS